MCIDEEPRDDGVLWRIEGRLTEAAAAPFERALRRPRFGPGANLTLDLSGVSLIDAGGLGAVATLCRACAAQGIGLTLVRVPPRVHHVLTITRLTDVLRVDDAGPAAPLVASPRLDGTAAAV